MTRSKNSAPTTKSSAWCNHHRLDEVPEALSYVGEGHARGKVVIAIGPNDPNGGSMAA